MIKSFQRIIWVEPRLLVFHSHEPFYGGLEQPGIGTLATRHSLVRSPCSFARLVRPDTWLARSVALPCWFAPWLTPKLVGKNDFLYPRVKLFCTMAHSLSLTSKPPREPTFGSVRSDTPPLRLSDSRSFRVPHVCSSALLLVCSLAFSVHPHIRFVCPIASEISPIT